jgi:hypothetical protein
MEEIKYDQSVYNSAFDIEKAKDTRTIPFIIAAEATAKEHRNKFSYNWDNWNLSNFNANPIVGYQHNVYGDNMCLAPNPDDVIGKATVTMGTHEGKRALIAETTFEPESINPTAEKVFQKVLWGSLKATSVGVSPLGKLETVYSKNEKGEILDYQINFPGQELLEFSIVNIPADAKALRRSMKSHTYAALNFLQRSLPHLSTNDMVKMSVKELLDLFEKSGGKEAAQLELELVGADPNVNKYEERLSKIKQNRKWTL